ncbi:unnamed protein product [Toxocara canis]|uniref:DUF4398 domain-containing protein n=1 Tax=Toxocara canis TaxID=6265 RepID=A0A183V8D7_TOXCA|nr:unnamed protein product [Toxocara canis]
MYVVVPQRCIILQWKDFKPLQSRRAMLQLTSSPMDESMAMAIRCTAIFPAQETRKGAYEIYKIAKDKLSSAAEQAYAAAGKLMANGQSYVEDARRKSADIYNEALARLNYAAEEAKVIAEEVFEGKEDPYNEPWENHDQVQDAYERVTDAAAKGLEKAYETFTELGKEAFQTVRDRRPGARSDEVFGESVDQEKSGKSAMGSSSRAEERSFEEALSEAKESQEGKQHRERYANPSAMIPPNQRSKYQLGETKDDHMRLSETLEWAANKKTIKEREGMQHTDDIIEQQPQKPADDAFGCPMNTVNRAIQPTTEKWRKVN